MIIEAHELRKTFVSGRGKGNEVEAVRGIDLEVADGEVFAVLGPNGAGKTTTVRMLATFTPPTSGRALVNGFDIVKQADKVRASIGYVSQSGGVDDLAPAIENLMLAGRIAGMSKAQAKARAEELMEIFALGEIGNRPARTLSGGQKRRFAVAIGLVAAPPLIFLDEPTTGLDPQNRANLWEEVRKLRAQGTSVLLTTHYLDEADALCDRLVIVDHGRIVAEGTPEALKKEVAGDVVTVKVADRIEQARALLSAEPYVREVVQEDDLLRAYLDDGERGLPSVLRALDRDGLVIQSITLSRATLDDVFLKHTGRSLRDAA
ncbi:ATP-binding cassette domain-containing protein [Herbidospora mongoliensis]|uniref:ATP-binding cassette domain-containing protein n=1 Tax=Herbidospora mongoliensis TaxID=688067 RepID=UPI0008309122|nr:ATP-binding cassette domain-containing protein [Herbidospora mongoliensis]